MRYNPENWPTHRKARLLRWSQTDTPASLNEIFKIDNARELIEVFKAEGIDTYRPGFGTKAQMKARYVQ